MKNLFLAYVVSGIRYNNRRLVWLLTLMTLGLNFLVTPLRASSLQDSPKAIIDEVWQLVNDQFVDRQFNHVNWLAKRHEMLSHSYTNSIAAYQAIRSALKGLGDPYTRFLSPEEFSQLTDQTAGEMSGIGISIAIEPDGKGLIVVDVLKNSPAAKADIKKGDLLLRINDISTLPMTLDDASREIQGEDGTKVNLQLVRNGKGLLNLTITREKIEIPNVSYSLKNENNLKIGYIKLDEFSSHASQEIKMAIQDLTKQKVIGFILDLRDNPGGLLFASVDIARLVLRHGDIVRTIDQVGGNKSYAANESSITDLPLVILVNEGSASASEILSGSLKQNKRAILVGTTTYGKGTVQSVHTLSDGSGLAITIAHYYLPNGIDINHKGITPDVVVNINSDKDSILQNNPSLVATKADPQYIEAVNILTKSKFSRASHTVTVKETQK